jgi:hypothetical protein
MAVWWALRLFVLVEVALVVCASPEALFQKMVTEVTEHPEETAPQHLAALRSRLRPFNGDPSVSFLDGQEKQAYELGASEDLGEADEPADDQVPEDGEDADGPQLSAEAEKKHAAELRARNPYDDKPDPPPTVQCFHQLVKDRDHAIKTSDELKKAAKIAGERYTAKNIVKKEALELSESARKDASAEHQAIMQRKRAFELHKTQTEAVLRHAKAKSDFYHQMEKDVEADAVRAKAAFKQYMKYKQLYIEANANSGKVDTKEIQQYKKISEQHLKAYSQFQVQMKDKKQNASGAYARYTELSKQYHAMVKEASHLSAQLTEMSDQYQHASSRFKLERSRYTKAADAEAAAAARQKGATDESNEKLELSEELGKQQKAAKRRYWELLAMVDKYSALIKEAQTTAEMQSVRWSSVDGKHKKLEAEEVQRHGEAKALTEKMKTAKEASKVFLQNYKEAGCASDEESGSMLDTNAQQVAAAKENQKTENPLDAATKPSATAVLYRNLYSKFKNQYKDALTKDTEVKLGEEKYSKCEYFNRLASMYGQLLDVHQTLHQHAQNENQLELALVHKQKAELNEKRVSHYTKLMKHSCNNHGRKLLADAMLDGGADGNDADQDAEALKAETCSRFKEVSTANMEAAETAKLGLETHSKFMKMLHEEVTKLKQAVDDAAARRDGAKVRIKRFEKIVDSAQKDLEHPC